MNARDTACLGLAAALALGALAGDAVADDAPSPAPSGKVHSGKVQSAKSAKTKVQPARAKVQPTKTKAQSAKVQPRPAAASKRTRASDASSAVSASLPRPMNARTLGLPASMKTPLATPAPVASTDLPAVTFGGTAVTLGGSGPASTDGSVPSAAPKNGMDAVELAQRLFDDQTPAELFTSVIAPAARGVTLAQIQPEGAPAVTLTVRPTKITRGSGLVAVGLF